MLKKMFYFTFRLINLMLKYLCIFRKASLGGEKKNMIDKQHDLFFPLPHNLFKVCHGQMNDIFGKPNGVNHGNRQEDHCRETSLCGLFRFYFTQLFNYTSSHKKMTRHLCVQGNPSCTCTASTQRGGWEPSASTRSADAQIVCLALGSSCLPVGGEFSKYFSSLCCAVFGSCPHRTQAKGQVEMSEPPRITRVNDKIW